MTSNPILKKNSIRASLAIALGCALWAGSHSVARADDPPFRQIDPDCMDNASPHVCTEVVAEIKDELNRYNQALNPVNVDEVMKFYHPQLIHYVSAMGRWFRGRDDFRDNFIAPWAQSMTSVALDLSQFHYRVVTPNLVIAYGAIPGVLNLKNGTTVMQTLPQTVTLVRNPDYDLARPFVVIANHE